MTKPNELKVSIVNTDKFFSMPIEAQLFYFHLRVRCDSEGAVFNPIGLAHLIRCGTCAIQILRDYGYITDLKEGGIEVLR